MIRLSRLIATGSVALLLLTQQGCTTTGEAKGSKSDPSPPVTALMGVGAETPGETWAGPANPRNFVELDAGGSATWSEGEVPRYSNTYIYETLDAPPIGPFVSAAYYDGGGFPIYYPYPYTIGSRQHDAPWYSSYRSSSRRFRSSGSAASGFGTAAVNAKTGRDAAAERARARGKSGARGVRSNAGRANPAAAAGAQQRATARGRQVAGTGSARSDERQPSAGYLAARARSGYRSGASHSRLYYRDRKGTARARPSGVARAHPSDRGRAGARARPSGVTRAYSSGRARSGARAGGRRR